MPRRLDKAATDALGKRLIDGDVPEAADLDELQLVLGDAFDELEVVRKIQLEATPERCCSVVLTKGRYFKSVPELLTRAS